jgi:hypothetical protein
MAKKVTPPSPVSLIFFSFLLVSIHFDEPIFTPRYYNRSRLNPHFSNFSSMLYNIAGTISIIECGPLFV